MKLRLLLVTWLLLVGSAGLVRAELDGYLHDLDLRARGNIGDFRTALGAHFDVSGAQLDVILRSVDRPAEAAVVLWLGQRTRQPIETVLRAYRHHHGQGWGAIAQSLGIKPGSAAFHALKRGDLGWRYGGGEGPPGKAKGREKRQ